MPYCFKPGETLDVPLPIDDVLPDAERIRWTIGVMSMAQTTAYNAAVGTADDDKLIAIILDAVKGWNRPEPLTRESLLALDLTPEQVFSLARGIPLAQFIGEREKKASRLRSPSVTANSAGAASGSVTTPQP